ncbi:hypothetical protein [Miltoncostaea marina]|uniref:hypothetical protein n=1 Tax=Miltoncostaea marina TaxID=2843215 RepID=UPI001C3D8F62|nr:hypothetical protein [Miltoncostaea marina]
MEPDRHGPHVLVADPSYGQGIDPAEAETAPVDVAVEGRPWRPVVPTPCTPGELAFIDGAQQIEAWLTVTPDGRPEAPLPAAAFAIAAGAVLAGPSGPARVAGLRSRRLVLTVGDRRLELPPGGGFAWEARCGAPGEAAGIARRVGEMRQQLELAVAEEIAAPDRLVVLDGRLSFIRDAGGPVVGAIKSHHRMYLPPEQARVVVALGVGQRTPLFAIGDDRLSWYQRLPGVGTAGWAGILRGEVARSAGVAEAVRLADRAACELPRFAGRPHRDARAPQNLSPIAALEAILRRRMGERRLALRAVRRAALRARLDDVPAGVGVAEADPLAA